jgi:hypothetical protein
MMSEAGEKVLVEMDITYIRNLRLTYRVEGFINVAGEKFKSTYNIYRSGNITPDGIWNTKDWSTVFYPNDYEPSYNIDYDQLIFLYYNTNQIRLLLHSFQTMEERLVDSKLYWGPAENVGERDELINKYIPDNM